MLLIQLIEFYVETVLVYSATLTRALELSNLANWRSHNVPMKDEFGEGWSYAFHGTGCFISSSELEIDFEFDANCEVGGFDVWRLWSFVCDNSKVSSAFLTFTDKEKMEKVFNQLVDANLIQERAGLYRLTDVIKFDS